MESSILETLGVDLISVISPVSICMFLVVLLISALSSSSSPSSSSAPPPVTAATLVYLESPSDSLSEKISGALLNAAVFVILIAAVTFLLLLLYYYNFTRFLKNYTRLSAFFVLSSMGGSILLSLLRALSLPLDAFSSLILLLNFSLVGVLSVFSDSVPIIIKQGYMISLAIIVAAWFTQLPEWTTWILLLALAVYDLMAVLCPGGPLRMLVEMASSRDEDLPALVYEARPTAVRSSPSPPAVLATAITTDVEMQPVNSADAGSHSHSVMVDVGNNDEEARSLLAGSSSGSSSNPTNPSSSRRPIRNNEDSDDGSGVDFDMIDSTRGIRLGLGDFVFYSVLVGRAAMYDLMTVYACYLVIVSGLGCTLILLTVFQRALPALPISITLGVAFYFLTRLLMEPFVVGASTNLVMF